MEVVLVPPPRRGLSTTSTVDSHRTMAVLRSSGTCPHQNGASQPPSSSEAAGRSALPPPHTTTRRQHGGGSHAGNMVETPTSPLERRQPWLGGQIKQSRASHALAGGRGGIHAHAELRRQRCKPPACRALHHLSAHENKTQTTKSVVIRQPTHQTHETGCKP